MFHKKCNVVFFSHRLVAIPGLKNPVCYTIYSLLKRDIFPKGHQHYVKCKQPHAGFELGSPYLFSMVITITPQAH